MPGRMRRILFGEPYEARFQSEGTGSVVHVYDGNGDEILTYTAGVGWHEKESKAETEVHGALKAAYAIQSLLTWCRILPLKREVGKQKKKKAGNCLVASDIF